LQISKFAYAFFMDFVVSVNNAGIVDCSKHCHCRPTDLLQLIDLKIAGYLHTQPGPAKIFGFFAARDRIEPLRNYVYRHGIDNYEAVPVERKMVIWFTFVLTLSLRNAM
jgi:hypothetical protein